MNEFNDMMMEGINDEIMVGLVKYFEDKEVEVRDIPPYLIYLFEVIALKHKMHPDHFCNFLEDIGKNYFNAYTKHETS